MWTAHLPNRSPEEAQSKAEFEHFVRNSRGVFDRAIQIMEDYMIKSETTPEDYDNPNWSHKQADINGHNRAIKRIIKLFS